MDKLGYCSNCGGTHEDTMGVCPLAIEPASMEEPREYDDYDEEDTPSPVKLPKVQLTKDMTATIDRRLDEVRIVENLEVVNLGTNIAGENMKWRMHFVPMARIRELCAKVS